MKGSHMRTLILLLALSVPAHAQAPAHAEIDCGTLEGSGIVRVMVDGRILRVDVHCGQRI
jgi:hypothetical protein